MVIAFHLESGCQSGWSHLETAEGFLYALVPIYLNEVANLATRADFLRQSL